MKYLFFVLCLALSSSAYGENAPMSLAGITLGTDISTVHHRCKLSTDIPLADERHLNEINLMPQIPGVKGGTLAYANCGQKGAIVRIKIKFDNPSQTFFDDLLSRYTNTWGKPKEWRGNPFRTVISWKWAFKNDQGQKINLELTHSDDDDYKMGNFVKLTYRSLYEEEDACFRRTLAPSDREVSMPTPADKLDYRLLIPQ